MTDFKKFKEKLPGEEKFYSSSASKFKMKTMKDYHDFYFNCYVLLLGDVFEKFRNKSFKRLT